MVAGTGANLLRRTHFDEKDNPIERYNPAVPIVFDKTIVMSNVGGAVEFGSVVIAGLPVGDLVILGGVLSLDIIETSANIVDTSTPSFALGTTATLDNNIGAPATDFDILVTKTTSASVAGVAPHQKQVLDGTAVVAGSSAAPYYIDNNAGTKAVNLNVTIPDAQITGAASIRVRGCLRMAIVGLGKNA